MHPLLLRPTRWVQEHPGPTRTGELGLVSRRLDSKKGDLAEASEVDSACKWVLEIPAFLTRRRDLAIHGGIVVSGVRRSSLISDRALAIHGGIVVSGVRRSSLMSDRALLTWCPCNPRRLIEKLSPMVFVVWPHCPPLSIYSASDSG